MANVLTKFGLPLAVAAFLYQALLRDYIFVSRGVGRNVQSIDNFPYTCRRIEDEGFQACEDMWLSDATRQLFLACSQSLPRAQWMPNIGLFNHSGRSSSDVVIAVDIDKPVIKSGRQSFEHRFLKTPNYPVEPHDDKSLHLVGLTGIDSPNTIELLLVNNKPSRDPTTGAFLDHSTHGANSTIERFITGPQATQMKHIRTYHDARIATPNNVATAPGLKGFYITNDHGVNKVGIFHTLSDYIGFGDVTYCDTSTPSTLKCTKLAGGFKFANGLLFHPEHNLLYVPSAVIGNIHVFRPHFAPGTTTPTLKKVYEIKVPYPIDNLSLDPFTGDIYAAVFPKAFEMIAGFADPEHHTAPSAAMRIQLVLGDKGKLKYEVEKVLEDTGGKNTPLTASTTVVKDGRTGRLFLSGEFCLCAMF